jgi:hypothetical protein
MAKRVPMNSPNRRSEHLHLIGDFYRGTYGPTIILIALSASGCRWLQEVFRDLARGMADQRILTAETGVRISNVGAIEMAVRPDGPRILLRHQDGGGSGSFLWSATPDGWLYLADLIAPLCDGGAGHHYLTEDKDDVAQIELSVGEEEVLRAVKAGRSRQIE